jgi:hypothetical protein
MLQKPVVLIIALVLFMSLASAESGIIDTGDTLTADLDNGAYIFVPGYFEFTNLSITQGQLQFWLNDSQIQWRTNTNKTLTNITFNTATDNLSFNANGTDGYLNFSGLMNNGSYNYSFYLDTVFQSYVTSDGDGIVTVNYTGAWSDHLFVVTPTIPNTAPTLSGIPDKNTNEDTDLLNTFDLDDYYFDADSDVPTFSVQSNNQSGSVTVDINAGNTVDFHLAANWYGVAEIVFNVSDGNGGTANDTMILTVASVNDNPVLEYIGPKNINELEELIIDLESTDVDGDTPEYSCNRTDLFADFDNVSGIGTWTPNSTQAGVYNVIFTVEDGNGGSDFEVVVITVNDLGITIDSYWNNQTGESLTLSVLPGSTVEFGVTTSVIADNISWYNGSTFLENDTATSQGNLTHTFDSEGVFYINVSAFNGSDWSGNTTFIVTVSYVTPTVVSYSPATPYSSINQSNITFEVEFSQTGNITWYFEGVEIQTNNTTTTASYTNTSSVTGGPYNITAIFINDAGTVSQTWQWTVSLQQDNEMPLSIFIMWSCVMMLGAFLGFTQTGIFGITTSLLSTIIAFMNSKMIINGTVVQYFAGVSSTDTIVTGYRSIESLPLSYIFMFIAIIMTIVFLLQLKNEIMYQIEPDIGDVDYE